MWYINYVNSDNEILIDNINNNLTTCFNSIISNNNQVLYLTWSNIDIIDNNINSKVEVTITISLSESSSITSWSMKWKVIEGTELGIWNAKLSIPFSVGNNIHGKLFFPSGFGTEYVNPTKNAGGGVQSTYPGSGATMQFMAIGSSEVTSAGYVAAHDPQANPKVLEYSTSIAMNKDIAIKKIAHDIPSPSKPSSIQSYRLHDDTIAAHNATGKEVISFLSITIYPADAGKAIPVGSYWETDYLITIGIISNVNEQAGRPLYFEAASLYRNWALTEAEWTRTGPFHSRLNPSDSDGKVLPVWYRHNHIWINTHWQCHDIFNETGGDPLFVADYVARIAEVLEQKSLALHWYEWQQGPDPDPVERYKFDTHYPDYFPPRSDFYDTVHSLLRNSGVRTIPYINGRIFDIASDSYYADDGEQYCAKETTPKIIYNADNIDDLVTYQESYGSNATFCVANPFEPYWQSKVSDVATELISKWGALGIYIDQIGSAGPKLCWDDEHGHTLGGGAWWRQGYVSMLKAINDNIATKSHAASIDSEDSVRAPIVTEDNAESYMDELQGFLTLVAFKCSLAMTTQLDSSHNSGVTSSDEYKRLAPAFPAVYGGYYVGFGAQWYQLDFDDHDWWRGKLAATFVTGTQMGWFSLTGISDDPDDSCGNMAVGDNLLDIDTNQDLIDYLKLLSNTRSLIVDYLIDGHLMRPMIMTPSPPIMTQSIPSGGHPAFNYDSIAISSWKLDKTNTIITILASTVANMGTFDTILTIDFENWGYNSINTNTNDTISFRVEQILSDNKRKYIDIFIFNVIKNTTPGSYHGKYIANIPIKIPETDVVILEFIPQ